MHLNLSLCRIIITTILLFVFGLSPSNGKINYDVTYPSTSKNVYVIKKPTVNVNTTDISDNYDDLYENTVSDVNNYNTYYNLTKLFFNFLHILTSKKCKLQININTNTTCNINYKFLHL